MRQIKIGSYVQVVVDKDSGMLIGRKGTVESLANDKYWIQLPNHAVLLPFGRDEIKAANKKKNM